MSSTSSTMLDLGTTAPFFSLPDADGAVVCLDDFWPARGLVVVFLCNHCPYVRHLRAEVAALARETTARGVGWVAIMPNDVQAWPQDGPEAMRHEREELAYPFPYLLDETQSVAKAYRAACTPDFYLFDQDRRLVYRGQFDDSRPGNDVPVSGRDLREAIEAVLAGRPVSADQTPSVGCGIKWKPGNEPGYVGG